MRNPTTATHLPSQTPDHRHARIEGDHNVVSLRSGQTDPGPLRSHPATRWRPPRVSLAPDMALPGMVGSSRPARALAQLVAKTAQTSLSVLILGETGTGKELIARALHEQGPRRHGPFVALNSSVLTGDLGVSHLFGHSAGAFTGATSARLGALRDASNGTLFLDELGSLPLDAQAKLLRVLEDGQVQPVGSDRSYPIDVRIVTATCERLDDLIARGRFRRDLYERLATCIVRVPTLDERREDIADIARWILSRSELADHVLTEAALQSLTAKTFPGNVRELRNVVLRAAVIADSREVGPGEIEAATSLAPDLAPRSPGLLATETLSIWRDAKRNTSLAARRAGLPRSTFRGHLQRALAMHPTHLEAPPTVRAGGDASRTRVEAPHSVRMLSPSSLRSLP
ncbi:MAG: sigma-54-dependent Fis family transcriptional regulator [Deltaproteobacteria bacterium]|nr:sigma-54-dependent Fis family transcriptional regulator [Deltaproteobacteria bacterium]